MENYSNYSSSYPDSRDSSPRSRDCDTASWDEPQQQQQQQSQKAKFMCSYGGKIQPRPHDNQLAYIGGDTKILSLDRGARFPAFMAKLSSMWPGADLCFKYQLPGEDLDALISVTNDEDLDHMMIEYDRLLRSSSSKPARLRLFLFPNHPSPPPPPPENASSSDRQWFVDALNSVQIQPPPPDASSSPPAPPPPTSQNNPDFLFGFDKAAAAAPPPAQQQQQPPSTAVISDAVSLPECGSEEQPPAEIQRHILELQRLQIAAQEQVMMQRKYEDVGNPRGFVAGGEYYSQSVRASEKLAAAAPPPPPAPVNVPAPPLPMQVPMQVPTSYVSERHVAAGGYHVPAAVGGNPIAPPPPVPVPQPQTGMDQPVYLIQTPGGVYHQAAAPLRPMTGPVGQPFYGVHPRAVPEAIYREATSGPGPVYNAPPNQAIPIMQAPPPSKAEQPGFAPVGFDSAGRQVYYPTTATTTAYQNVGPAVSGGTGVGGGGVSQDGKVVVGMVSQSSAM